MVLCLSMSCRQSESYSILWLRCPFCPLGDTTDKSCAVVSFSIQTDLKFMSLLCVVQQLLFHQEDLIQMDSHLSSFRFLKNNKIYLASKRGFSSLLLKNWLCCLQQQIKWNSFTSSLQGAARAQESNKQTWPACKTSFNLYLYRLTWNQEVRHNLYHLKEQINQDIT